MEDKLRYDFFAFKTRLELKKGPAHSPVDNISGDIPCRVNGDSDILIHLCCGFRLCCIEHSRRMQKEAREGVRRRMICRVLISEAELVLSV